MFEEFVNRVRDEKGMTTHWSHEDGSIALLDYLIEKNKIQLSTHGLNELDLNFIKKLIDGLKPNEAWPNNIGRGVEKRFLFDIVANKRNGIDVDKLDVWWGVL
jgi:hypothetical protein